MQTSLCWDGLLFSLEEAVLEYLQASLGPSSVQGLIPWSSFNLTETKVYSSEVQQFFHRPLCLQVIPSLPVSLMNSKAPLLFVSL